MERSPKSHREEQIAVTKSKQKLANSKLRLIWECSIRGAYQKRERLGEVDQAATTREVKAIFVFAYLDLSFLRSKILW
jgi:hypothetical protein